MIYLLDNNVLSELWRPRPDPKVLQWVYSSEWYLPVPVVAEIQEGAEAAPSQARKVEINAKLDAFLRDFSHTVVDWDTEAARTWGRLKHSPGVKRHPQPLWDSLLDAMAVSLSARIATRKKNHFRHATTFDPWTGLEHPPAQLPAR